MPGMGFELGFPEASRGTKLIRALLVAVDFTVAPWLSLMGRALDSFLDSAATSCCFKRSSLFSFNFCAIASPGRMNEARVGGFFDFTGFGALISTF